MSPSSADSGTLVPVTCTGSQFADGSRPARCRRTGWMPDDEQRRPEEIERGTGPARPAFRGRWLPQPASGASMGGRGEGVGRGTGRAVDRSGAHPGSVTLGVNIVDAGMSIQPGADVDRDRETSRCRWTMRTIPVTVNRRADAGQGLAGHGDRRVITRETRPAGEPVESPGPRSPPQRSSPDQIDSGGSGPAGRCWFLADHIPGRSGQFVRGHPLSP